MRSISTTSYNWCTVCEQQPGPPPRPRTTAVHLHDLVQLVHRTRTTLQRSLLALIRFLPMFRVDQDQGGGKDLHVIQSYGRFQRFRIDRGPQRRLRHCHSQTGWGVTVHQSREVPTREENIPFAVGTLCREDHLPDHLFRDHHAAIPPSRVTSPDVVMTTNDPLQRCHDHHDLVRPASTTPPQSSLTKSIKSPVQIKRHILDLFSSFWMRRARQSFSLSGVVACQGASVRAANPDSIFSFFRAGSNRGSAGDPPKVSAGRLKSKDLSDAILARGDAKNALLVPARGEPSPVSNLDNESLPAECSPAKDICCSEKPETCVTTVGASRLSDAR